MANTKKTRSSGRGNKRTKEDNSGVVWKCIVVAVLAISIIGIGIAFATLTTTLQINGMAKVNGADWEIKFANLGAAVEVGGGKEDGTAPTLTDTSIANVKAVFDEAGSVAYEFDVTNTGSIDAEITSINIMGTPTCTGSGTDQAADEALVCGAISTSLTYVTGGTAVAVNDTLDAGDTKRMKFTITYAPAAGTHPANQVDVSGLGATIIYSEV